MPCWGHPEPAGLPPHNASSCLATRFARQMARSERGPRLLEITGRVCWPEHRGILRAVTVPSALSQAAARAPGEPYGRRYTRYFARRSSKKRAITISKRTAAVP